MKRREEKDLRGSETHRQTEILEVGCLPILYNSGNVIYLFFFFIILNFICQGHHTFRNITAKVPNVTKKLGHITQS